ncbi:podocalyxin [Chaetodon trifascialis]|uniref:podocalyxin n=1 Tax=Chaetodon trifascialis TaxID=109706 RepID=UPI003993E53A
MRATMRITWLLLSLSFLFHGIYSEDDSQNAPSVPENVTSVMTTTTSVTEPTTGPQNITKGATKEPPADDGKKHETTQEPAPTKPNAVVPTPAVAVKNTSSVTGEPVPTEPQASTVTKNTTAHLTTISGGSPTAVYATTPAAGTSSQVKTTTPVATAVSSDSLVVSTYPATVGTSAASLPKTSATEAHVNQSGAATHEGTTKIPKVSTDARTTQQQVMAHTTSTSSTSQEDGNGEKMTVADANHGQPTPKAPWPAGNTETTSTPSTLINAGLSPAETISTKAGTTLLQTTPATTTTTTTTTTTAAVQPKIFSYSLNSGHEKEEEKDLAEVCRRLMTNLQDGNCTLTWRHHNGKIQFDRVEINGKVKTTLATQYYEEITKKPTDNKTLIAILASSGALLIMIVILAVCASHHRKPYNENQQHLTEELHTVENGYHDNPTLEVMEVQPEMQEKKMALNGEFNDSWIVPIDNLLKEDIPDEEDTHL